MIPRAILEEFLKYLCEDPMYGAARLVRWPGGGNSDAARAIDLVKTAGTCMAAENLEGALAAAEKACECAARAYGDCAPSKMWDDRLKSTEKEIERGDDEDEPEDPDDPDDPEDPVDADEPEDPDDPEEALKEDEKE